jgi:hypothetical protein
VLGHEIEPPVHSNCSRQHPCVGYQDDKAFRKRMNDSLEVEVLYPA